MSAPYFFWLLAAGLDASLFLLLLRRRRTPLHWLIGFKLVSHIALFSVRANPAAYLWTYCAYTWILSAVVCWNIQALARFEWLAFRCAILVSICGAAVSIQCQDPGLPTLIFALRTLDRLTWLAPLSLLLYGYIEPPVQVSVRARVQYLGFAFWAVAGIMKSFAILSGLGGSWYFASMAYPLAPICWITACLLDEPIARKPVQSVKINSCELQNAPQLLTRCSGRE